MHENGRNFRPGGHMKLGLKRVVQEATRYTSGALNEQKAIFVGRILVGWTGLVQCMHALSRKQVRAQSFGFQN